MTGSRQRSSGETPGCGPETRLRLVSRALRGIREGPGAFGSFGRLQRLELLGRQVALDGCVVLRRAIPKTAPPSIKRMDGRRGFSTF
jgi:hypothetical protein